MTRRTLARSGIERALYDTIMPHHRRARTAPTVTSPETKPGPKTTTASGSDHHHLYQGWMGLLFSKASSPSSPHEFCLLSGYPSLTHTHPSLPPLLHSFLPYKMSCPGLPHLCLPTLLSSTQRLALMDRWSRLGYMDTKEMYLCIHSAYQKRKKWEVRRDEGWMK